MQDLHNCCSPQRTGQCAVIGCKLKQNAKEGCSSWLQQLCKSYRTCFKFYCMFYFT